MTASAKIIEWDDDGYPTEESLKRLREELNSENLKRAIEVFYAALKENRYPDYCGFERVEVRGELIEVWGYHTGGWSGNENIIAVLRESWLFNWLLERYDRGGHYYFRPEPKIYGNPAKIYFKSNGGGRAKASP